MSSTANHKVEHFEIPADDVENLKNFYTSLFGWQFEKGQTQGYWMVKNCWNKWSIDAKGKSTAIINTICNC